MPDVDITTIESSFEGRLKGLLKWKYFKGILSVKKSFSKAIPPIQNWSAKFKWHISGSHGPNGSVSYTQYLDDLRALSHSWLTVGLTILLLTLPYDNKWETVKALRDAFRAAATEGDSNSIHSRLAFLSEKSCKTRVVAIGDILSQSLLYTVHQRCNLILRRLSQDGTFDQDRARSKVKKMSLNNVQLASIDLTAATDRMPALFQMWVIVHLRILTPIQAIGWWWVTTRRTFVYKDKGILKCTRYTVGQPMGLLSSWPVMAISHHYLVRLAFAANGFKKLKYAPYLVLGDDLTLRGHGVAGEYLRLIDYLGMKYSPEKTYISTGVAEFAKSLFCHGEDLSPFPIALLRFNRNTVVSNTLAVVAECKRAKLGLTAQLLTGLFPKRWRNLVLLAALSPSSPRLGLDLHSRSDQWIFQQYVNAKRIVYFSRKRTMRNSIYAFVLNDPVDLPEIGSSPFQQIARDNGVSYPVQHIRDDKLLLSPYVLIGSNWISYDSNVWPNGIPLLGSQKLVPGPSWDKRKDDLIMRSSLLTFNRLMPGYFTVRCVGKQVGDIEIEETD